MQLGSTPWTLTRLLNPLSSKIQNNHLLQSESICKAIQFAWSGRREGLFVYIFSMSVGVLLPGWLRSVTCFCVPRTKQHENTSLLHTNVVFVHKEAFFICFLVHSLRSFRRRRHFWPEGLWWEGTCSRIINELGHFLSWANYIELRGIAASDLVPI